MIEILNFPRADGLSPDQMTFGQPTRSHVVTHCRAFRVMWQKETTKADREAVQMKLKAKECYDRHSRKLPDLPVGALVRIQHPIKKLWQNIGETIEERHGRRRFLVPTESGRVYWRHRQFFEVVFTFTMKTDARLQTCWCCALCREIFLFVFSVVFVYFIFLYFIRPFRSIKLVGGGGHVML